MTFKRKRFFSGLLAVALVLTTPFTAFAAEKEIPDTYVSGQMTGGAKKGFADVRAGATEHKVADGGSLLDLLQSGKVQDGDTIVLEGTAWVNDKDSNAYPLVIDKNIAIRGGQSGGNLALRAGGILLKADVSFENLTFSFTNPVRNVIMANGHTLKLNNVTKANGTRQVHLLCGGLTGHAVSAPEGSHGQIIVQGNTSLGNLYAGSLSSDGQANSYSKPATITIDSLANGKMGEIYASGAMEAFVDQNEMLNPDYEPAPPTADDTKYPVTGDVNLSLYGGVVRKVNGKTGGNTNAKVIHNSKDYLIGNVVFSDISALSVPSGKLQPAAGTTLDSAASVSVAPGARLYLSNLGDNLSIGDFHGGGEVVLGQGQKWTISQAVSGTTKVAIGDVNFDGSNSTAVPKTNHAYITAVQSQDNSFQLIPYAASPDQTFTRNGNGVWSVGAMAAASVKVQSASLPADVTVSEQNIGAQIPVTVVYAGSEEGVCYIPVEITVNGTKAVRSGNETDGYSYSYYKNDNEQFKSMEFAVTDIDGTDTECLCIDGAPPLGRIAPGTYQIQCTIPAAHTENNQPITMNSALTVSDSTVNPGTSDLKDATVTVTGSYVYNGREQIPEVEVSLGGVKLVKDTDYTVLAANNINAGQATVTVTAVPGSKYTGSAQTFFTILKADGPAAPDVKGSYAISKKDAEKFAYTVSGITDAEYQMDGTEDGKWQEENVFDGIVPNSSHIFYARIKETTNSKAGRPGNTGTVNFVKLDNPDIPPLSVSVSGESGKRTVTIGEVAGAEYSFDGGVWSDVRTKSGIADEVVRVSVRYKETATMKASTAASQSVDTAKKQQAALTINEVGAKTYGDGDFVLSAVGGSGTGSVTFASSDSSVISISGTTASIHRAGKVLITATKQGDNSYNPITAKLTVNVSKRVLTVKADDKNVTVGGKMPELTYTITGLVNGDTMKGLTISAAVKNTDTAGNYPISVSGGVLTNTDSYAVSYKGGTLVVNAKTTPALTLTANPAVLSGKGNVTLTVGGLPNGGKASVTCSNHSVSLTEDKGVWTATLPNATAEYTFTASYAGDALHNSASVSCIVSVKYKMPDNGNSGDGGNNSGSSSSGGGASGGNESSKGDSAEGKHPGENKPQKPDKDGVQKPDEDGAQRSDGNMTQKPGGNNTQRPTENNRRPETGIPFIKDETGNGGTDVKNGWSAVRRNLRESEENGSILVDMNGTSAVPGSVFDTMKGKDVNLILDMGGGITWSVNGKSVSADENREIDFEVLVGEDAADTIPADVIRAVTGEREFVKLSLAHDGEFGFTAVLSLDMGSKNAGRYANLFYYEEEAGELNFICADEIDEDGMAEFTFTHASDYIVVIDQTSMQDGVGAEQSYETGRAEEAENTGAAEGTDNSSEAEDAFKPQTDAGNFWFILVIVIIIILAGTGIVFIIKREGRR